MRVNSIYAGIVIQNNDPDMAGRVKVFIPGVTNTVYDNWNGVNEDKLFSFIDGSVLPILATLQEDLPWADCATSTFGGDTSQINSQESSTPLERPSDGFVQTPPKDAFNNEVYIPGNYSGTSSGNYSIPSVGSHVYVFFKLGDVNYPVYFASTHSMDEWQDIFKDHYPTDYENFSTVTGEYQNKHVINSSTHTLEFIDSKDKEEIKLSHYSGSNIQMLNDYTSYFTVGDKLSLVNGNETYTVVKDVNGRINGNFTETIDKDVTTTIVGANSIDISKTQDVHIVDKQTITVDADILMESKTKITLKVGGSTITMTAGSIVMKSGAIALN